MVGIARRYDGPMGKSDRAFAFGALGLCVGLGGPLPSAAFWLMPAIALLHRLEHRQPRAPRRGRRREAVHRERSRAAGLALADRCAGHRAPRPSTRSTRTTASRCSTGAGRRRPGRRAARSCSSIAGTSTRAAWITCPAELDLPEFDFFAWDARGHGRSPGARGDSPSFGTSVRDVETFIAHIGDALRLPPEVDRHHRAERRRGRRATWVHDYAPPHSRDGARIAGVQGEALRSARAAGVAAHAGAAREFLRHELRQGAAADPRSGAHRVLRHRPADRAVDLGQHPARIAGGLRPDRRRRRRRSPCPRSS